MIVTIMRVVMVMILIAGGEGFARLSRVRHWIWIDLTMRQWRGIMTTSGDDSGDGPGANRTTCLPKTTSRGRDTAALLPGWQRDGRPVRVCVRSASASASLRLRLARPLRAGKGMCDLVLLFFYVVLFFIFLFVYGFHFY